MEILTLPEIANVKALSDLEGYLNRRVIGQEMAKNEIVDSLNTSLAGLNPPNHPIASLMFPGPTGVGKTELARALADYFYGKFSDEIKKIEEEENERLKQEAGNCGFRKYKLPKIVKVDCGRFAGSMSHAANNLLGAPVSFVGREQSPILCRDNFPPGIIRVLLFDEIEKAYLDSRDNGAELTGILMALLDEAKVQNNFNEEVSFVSAIVIFTTNFGARDILKEATGKKIGFCANTEKSEGFCLSMDKIKEINDKIYFMIRDKLKSSNSPFLPELMNRLDRISVFRFLTLGEYHSILDKEIAFLNSQLRRQKKRIRVELSPEAADWILNRGIDFEYGVRSLQRFLRRKVRDPLGRLLNADILKPGSILEIKPGNDDNLAFFLQDNLSDNSSES